jgi:hypothetical protein
MCLPSNWVQDKQKGTLRACNVTQSKVTRCHWRYPKKVIYVPNLKGLRSGLEYRSKQQWQLRWVTGSWPWRIGRRINAFEGFGLMAPCGIPVPVPRVSLQIYFCGQEGGQCYVCLRRAGCTKANYGLFGCLHSNMWSKWLVGNMRKPS